VGGRAHEPGVSSGAEWSGTCLRGVGGGDGNAASGSVIVIACCETADFASRGGDFVEEAVRVVVVVNGVSSGCGWLSSLSLLLLLFVWRVAEKTGMKASARDAQKWADGDSPSTPRCVVMLKPCRSRMQESRHA
jgi:hypothetical protein